MSKHERTREALASTGFWTDADTEWFDVVEKGSKVQFWVNGVPVFTPSDEQLVEIRDCLTQVIGRKP